MTQRADQVNGTGLTPNIAAIDAIEQITTANVGVIGADSR